MSGNAVMLVVNQVELGGKQWKFAGVKLVPYKNWAHFCWQN